MEIKEDETKIGSPFYLIAKSEELSLDIWFLENDVVLSDDYGALAIYKDNQFIQDADLQKGAGSCSDEPVIMFGDMYKSAWMIQNWTPNRLDRSIGTIYEWGGSGWKKLKEFDLSEFSARPWKDGAYLAIEERHFGETNSWNFSKLGKAGKLRLPRPTRSRKEGCAYKLTNPKSMHVFSKGIVVLGSICELELEEDELPEEMYEDLEIEDPLIESFAMERFRDGKRRGKLIAFPDRLGFVYWVEVLSYDEVWTASMVMRKGKWMPLLSKLKGNRWKTARPALPKEMGMITRFVPRTSKDIWVFAKSQKDSKVTDLWHSDGQSWNKINNEGFEIPIVAVEYENNGDVWILVTDGFEELELWRVNEVAGLKKIELPKDLEPPFSLRVVKDGDVWLKTARSIFRSIKPDKTLDWRILDCEQRKEESSEAKGAYCRKCHRFFDNKDCIKKRCPPENPKERAEYHVETYRYLRNVFGKGEIFLFCAGQAYDEYRSIENAIIQYGRFIKVVEEEGKEEGNSNYKIAKKRVEKLKLELETGK
ncbi:MAG: hypothetical protein GY854_18485 [Deltaproteobacteria bacterium]|nr:hypothetical protein [Deltaproteobacteria bacterium]